MAYGEGQLSGSADYRVGLDNYVASQNQAGNYSTMWWGVYLQNPNGQGAWFNDNGSWTCSAWSGTGYFNRPSGAGGTVTQLLGSGYVDAGHDGNGYRHVDTSAYIVTPHAAIGSGGVTVSQDLTRIPKRPSPPPFSIDQITPTSFRVVVSASADNGGSSITAYLIRVSSNPRADTGGTFEDFPGSGTRTITGRTPGATYYVTVYAKNGSADNSGYSSYQTSKSAVLPAGVWVSDGTKWVATSIRVSDGAAWSQPMPKISDGAAWQNPINLTP